MEEVLILSVVGWQRGKEEARRGGGFVALARFTGTAVIKRGSS